jgi:hypothetical protein
LDSYIDQATQAMKQAQKKVNEAKALARNERRKKQRLLKKAASLSPADLERIAVLKRCGMMPTAASGSAASDARPGSSIDGGIADEPDDKKQCAPGRKSPVPTEDDDESEAGADPANRE